MTLHLKEINTEKARRGFHEAVTIASGETLFAVHDDTAFGSCAIGFAITDRRLVLFRKGRVRDVAWPDLKEIKAENGFPYMLQLRVGDKEDSFAVGGERELSWVTAALRAAREGNFGPAGTSLDAASPSQASVAAADRERLSTQPLKLFHGKEVPDDGTDWTYAFGALVVGAIVLVAFRLGGNMDSGFSVIFAVSFWAGLVAYPIVVVSAFRAAAKPGARKVVYAVSELRFGRKRLRGSDDPLWNATEAPADMDLLGLRDRDWQRGANVVVTLRDGNIVVVETTKHAVSGKMDLTDTITPDEFADRSTFDSLAAALGLREGKAGAPLD